MSISYNSTDGLIISAANPADSTTITCTKTDGSQADSVIISPTNVTFNVPIQVPTTLPMTNMIGHTTYVSISSNITLSPDSNNVVNVGTISSLAPGTYLFKGVIICKTSQTSNQTNKVRRRLAMQFNDISSNIIDYSGKYGGYDDFSSVPFVSPFTNNFAFSYTVQSILNIPTTRSVYFNIIFNHNISAFSIQAGSIPSSYTYTRIA